MASITVNITESITEIMATMENKNQETNGQETKKINKVALIACVLFLIAAIVCIGIFISQQNNQRQAEEQFEHLAEDTVTTEESTEPETIVETTMETEVVEEEPSPIEKLEEMGVPIPEKTIDFADLQANTNEDIYAWIYIPDSEIDYPVLQHPTDNYYYLNYNLDGSKGYPGCIYTEDYNAKDFSDPNTVLYGHNMKNGTMFAGLHKFEDIEYFDANRYVYIYTPDELLVYEIFAAYEYSDEHILYNHDFTNETIYQNYLDGIKETRTMNCNLREEIEVTTADRIITLSTCIASKPNNRYLVQGVLLNED